ncbi:hypothetical protein D3C80_1502510 [compost metagenome]
MRPGIGGVPRQLACDIGELAPFLGKTLLTNVKRHHRVTVAGNDLGTGTDERCVHTNYRFGRLAQRQRRPFRLAKRRPTALQLTAHATVENHHRSLFHITTLQVLMNKIHYVSCVYNY